MDKSHDKEDVKKTKMKKHIITILIFILLLGCADKPMPTAHNESPNIKQLKNIEINDYKGERLDSMVDVLDVSIKGPQQVNIDEYLLEIDGLVDNPLKLSYDEVISNKKYRKVVMINCVMGWSATVLWEGVLLSDLLEKAQVMPGANTVIFHAVDGYTTSLPLDYIIDNNILLADKINNVTLVPERGFPFQVVAESKLGYKWIKWVDKITLSDNPDYEGYWENRGYDNQADV